MICCDPCGLAKGKTGLYYSLPAIGTEGIEEDISPARRTMGEQSGWFDETGFHLTSWTSS
jgi:hypothetical protein